MTMRTQLRCALVLIALGLGGCRRGGEPPNAEEAPTLDVTHWTDRTELYMEYPPLAAGQNALFAVHLTTLADFKPVTAGEATVEFTPVAGGAPTMLKGPKPSRPGAFRVEGAAPTAGEYRFALLLNTPGFSDRHDLGTVTVFSDQPSANVEAERHSSEDPAAIAYLKEQQWVNEFATAPVAEAEVRTSIRAPATVHPLPGGEAVVAAPAAGRLAGKVLPSIGVRVNAGQILGQIEPRLSAGPDHATLTAEVAEAQTVLEAARADQTRAERLLAERAVPARRAEDARRATTIAESRLRAAEARLTQREQTLRTGGGAAAGNAFVLRAPISGRIAEVMATLGASYDEGALLFRIVRTDRVELEVQIPSADVAIARQATGVALEIPGLSKPLTLQPQHVHDAGVLDAATRALPLQMEIPNPGEQLLVGQGGTAVLFSNVRRQMATVPSAAVLMEAGRPYVFVQVGGERFARRFIEIADRDGDLVGVRSGVKTGERVVTRGAYEVQLASAARGLPAEGHVH
jgi:membrane fusion protein, heavy metal efflux system